MRWVSRRYPKPGFVSMGKLPVERLGLSRRRSMELGLAHAWTKAAGPALSQKAVPAVRGGVLELRMREDDESWRQPLYDLLPQLAAAIAADRPALGIVGVRLFSTAGEPVGPVQSLPSSSA